MSIRQFPATHPLPDWRNFGVMLRVLLGVNALALAAALLQVPELALWPSRFVDLAAIVEPLLLISLGLLSLGRGLLWRLPLRAGQALVLVLAGGLAFALYGYWGWLLPDDAGSPWRAALLAMTAAALLLLYFDLRSGAFDPAQTEARLAALNARIRPHFLFNSLNAVLSLIRARPQQAEAALESLSDLFRAAMRDPKELVSLGEEIELAKQYLELEHLRLGERLSVDWQIADLSLDLLIPPLMLQPLLENAVYHGIEPTPAGGTVHIAITRRDDALCIAIGNPVSGPTARTDGNRIALANIRERLALYYDLEARLEIEHGITAYEVRIVLPWPKKNR
ncbi:histidine kinase [Azonexus sp.]|jgi:two-component system sensor histidine kinase AlgZ|uniref:sensor histidine kinase n=1 Tax=Azonexus sp. TaxID=1872668 RepID=UPI002824FDB4|nr:histidine kinase [Azonexus sp.]MDR1995241.1 histidine kinase [Azonexus sp.]